MTERQRILVVDDQPEILEVTTMVLAGAGFDVQTASNGGEALARAADERVDLVLLDINMPGMDGWETLRLLRADEELERLPILMFSVKGEVSDQVQSLKEGATGYVTKPFVADELIDRIRRALVEVEEGLPARDSGGVP
jgi:DNA-binding response OmpR family regulator